MRVQAHSLPVSGETRIISVLESQQSALPKLIVETNRSISPPPSYFHRDFDAVGARISETRRPLLPRPARSSAAAPALRSPRSSTRAAPLAPPPGDGNHGNGVKFVAHCFSRSASIRAFYLSVSPCLSPETHTHTHTHTCFDSTAAAYAGEKLSSVMATSSRMMLKSRARSVSSLRTSSDTC